IGQQLYVVNVRQKDHLTLQTMGFGEAPHGNQAFRLHAVPLLRRNTAVATRRPCQPPGWPRVTVCLSLVCPAPAGNGGNPRAPADVGPDRRVVRHETATGAPCRRPAWLRLDW